MILKRSIVVIITTTVLVVCFSWLKFLFTPLITDDQGYQYTVKPGSSLKSVTNDLYFKNIIKNQLFFNLLIAWHSNGHDLKAGEYLFSKGTTPTKLLNQLFSGSGLAYHAFTIIPGWNMRQLRAAILQETYLRHTLQDMSNTMLMDHLGHPEIKPEGQFYPDTYYFVSGSSDIALLKRAFKAMQDKLNMAWQSREAGLPFKNLNEVLTAASIIEKETEYDIERPIIAGVLINRLRKGMLLQVDPTVIYGMGTRFNGIIHKENLLENTPYNTYVHKGLPPTPIAIPGLASIKAVVHPQQHDYLYFVARKGKDGPHQFSRTLAEHHAAVAVSKRERSQFFNNELIRYHLLKLFSDQVIRFPLAKTNET